MAFIKQLGANEAIDYKNQRFEEETGNLDLVFDPIGGETQKRSLEVLNEGGRLVTTVKPEFGQDAKEKHIQLEGFTAQSYPEDLEQIARLVDDGFVNPVISSILSLEEARKAEMLNHEGNTRGKIVIKVV